MTHLAVDLAPHRNNTACHAKSMIAAEGIDGFGRAFATQGLDDLAHQVGLPEQWGHGAPDNVACEGQVLQLDVPVTVRAMTVLGAASGGAISEVFVVWDDDTAVAKPVVELSDFLAQNPMYGNTRFAASEFLYDIGGRRERRARPSLWLAEVNLPEAVRCTRLELPVNPDLHVFGLWLTP